MIYRRDVRNRSLDDFGEAKNKQALKGRRPERAPRPLVATSPVLAAAPALK